MSRPSTLAAAAALAVVAVVSGGAPASAAGSVSLSTAATGFDVSFPQCAIALPARGELAVVGVNAGVGTTTNPCLAAQLAWGDAPAADGTAQLADVYVNTADPGHLSGWWPNDDRTRAGAAVASPTGTCVGAENPACAYVYGYSVATDDATIRGVTHVAARTWWLDVETVNSWSWDRSANRAVLEGMTDALRARGATVGIYSTQRQWSLIVGATPATSPLAGLPSWVAGAVTAEGAAASCGTPALTPGGRVAIAQWVADGLDHDRTCLPALAAARPTIQGSAVPGGLLVASAHPDRDRTARTAFQWLRDGIPIAGATGTVYQATEADVGSALAVRLVRHRIGSPVLRSTSAPLLVTAAPSSTSAPAASAPARTAPQSASPAPTTTPAPTTSPSLSPGVGTALLPA